MAGDRRPRVKRPETLGDAIGSAAAFAGLIAALMFATGHNTSGENHKKSNAESVSSCAKVAGNAAVSTELDKNHIQHGWGGVHAIGDEPSGQEGQAGFVGGQDGKDAITVFYYGKPDSHGECDYKAYIAKNGSSVFVGSPRPTGEQIEAAIRHSANS